MANKDIVISKVPGKNLELFITNKYMGSQYDHKATTLVFSRPEEYLEDDLILLFANRSKAFNKINIGQSNNYQVINTLTQETELLVQVAFERDGDIVAHTETETFLLNKSIKPGNQEIVEIESPLTDVWKKIAQLQETVSQLQSGQGNSEEIESLKAEIEMLESSLKTCSELLDAINGEVIE